MGRVFHTTPNIVHYKNNQQLGTMQPGHIFTIEPMINEGTHDNKVTYVSRGVPSMTHESHLTDERSEFHQVVSPGIHGGVCLCMPYSPLHD